MATTITGKLNKAATQFQAGESIGFGVRLGVKYFDRETKTEQWTNYEAVVFAKAPAQIQFYQQVLVEGAIIEVTGDKQKIRQFQGQNGLQLSIELLDAKLGYVGMSVAQQNRPPQPPAQNQAPAYNQAPQQHAYNQPPQGAYNQNTNQNRAPMEPPIDFDDDIPF